MSAALDGERNQMLHPFSGWLSLRCVAAMAKPPLGVLRGNGGESRINGDFQCLARAGPST